MISIPVKDDGITKRKLPRTLLPFFFISSFIFGVDFGFSFHLDPKYRLLSKIISTVISFIMIALMLIPLQNTHDFFWVFWFCEYVFYFIIFKTIRYYPCNFLLDLCLPTDQVTNLSRVVNCYSLLSMIFTFVISPIRCLDSYVKVPELCNIRNLILYSFNTWPVMSLDLVSVALCIIFRCTSLKLKHFRKELKISKIKLKYFLHQYIKIADRYDEVKPFLNRVVITSLVIGVPKFMTLLWYELRILKDEEISWSHYLRSVTLPVHIALQVCLPAFVAETINNEIDAIKVVLSEKIAKGKDEKTMKSKLICKSAVTGNNLNHTVDNDTQIVEANHVLQYLDRRLLRHEIFSIVPLDVRLPIGLFGLCSTYFIVILQFTHLYE